MTYLEQLLEGAAVEWKPLGEVAHYEQPAKYIVESTDYKDSFPTPVLTAGKTFILGYTDEMEGIYPASEHPVIIFDDFTGALRWIDFDFKVKSSAMKMITSEDESVVLLRFIFYWLSHLPSQFVAHDHQRLWLRKYAPILIPLPPLRVQERIVEILDKFTALEARKKQYEYYRNKLLRFGKEVEWRPLGEVAELKRGTSITQNTSTEGGYPVISGGRQPAYYVDQFNRTGETITVAGSGAYAGFLQYWNEPIFVGDAFSIKPDPSLLLTRFVYFFLLKQQQKLHDMKVGGAVPHVYTKFVAPLLIPLPPLAVQEQIVAILDKFHTLVHSLSEGLPAEIALRRRQYEYYRNLLLRFPRS